MKKLLSEMSSKTFAIAAVCLVVLCGGIYVIASPPASGPARVRSNLKTGQHMCPHCSGHKEGYVRTRRHGESESYWDIQSCRVCKGKGWVYYDVNDNYNPGRYASFRLKKP